MFKRGEESNYEEGNGYKINNVPLDVNYNTCNVRYTLNNDFYKTPQAQYKDSTNAHTRRTHTDVNASTNEQRLSGMNCSRPMNNQTSSSIGNQRTMGTPRTGSTGTPRTMNNQRTSGASKPVAKKVSPIGILILPIVIILIFIFAINGEEFFSLIPIIVAVGAIFSKINKANRRR